MSVVEKSFFEKFLLEEVINTAEGVIKVSNFLHMWLHKRRYRIARQRIILIQTQYRLYQRRKQRVQARIALLDEERVKRMEIYCRHFKDKQRLNGMATRIQRELMKRIRRSNQAKELRK